MAAYSPADLNPSFFSQFSNDPSDMFAWKMDTILESAYGSKLENVPQGDFEATVLSGYRTQESTGAGTDQFDARVVEGFGGNKYLEIKVRPLGIGTGRMLPDPNHPDLTPEQRTSVIGMHEWARSEFTVEGLDSALNCGDLVMCYYKHGNVAKSDFTGLRFKAPSLSPSEASLMLQEFAEGNLAGFFSGQVSTMGALMLGSPSPPDGIVDNPGTFISTFKGAFNGQGYVWDERYNIVGVRTPGGVDTFNDFVFLCIRDENRFEEFKTAEEAALTSGIPVASAFQTAAGAGRFEEGIDDWQVRKFAATTKPGKNVLLDPNRYNSSGTGAAILVPGQYMNTWTIGIHGKKLNEDGTVKKPGHTALRQTDGSVDLYRDNNKDANHDYVNMVENKYAGINIHQSGPGVTTKVGWYSAGCQVFQSQTEFETFMGLIQGLATSHNISSFAYTLLLQNEI